VLRWASDAAPAPAAAACAATSWAVGSGVRGTSPACSQASASATSALDDEPAEVIDDEIEIDSDIEVIYSEDDAW
jgi:hypothetical protein